MLPGNAVGSDVIAGGPALLALQFTRFVAVGLLNTAVGLLVISSMLYFAGASALFANITGYAVGLTVSFVLNRNWTFRGAHSVWRSAVRFLAVFVVAYAVNLAVLFHILSDARLGPYLGPYVAQAVAMVCYSVTFFIGCRFFAFTQDGLPTGER
jgi:putative flippase GtrA